MITPRLTAKALQREIERLGLYCRLFVSAEGILCALGRGEFFEVRHPDFALGELGLMHAPVEARWVRRALTASL